MKKSYKDELRARDIAWLEAHTQTLKQKLAQLQFETRSGKNKNHTECQKIKKEIATVLTFIYEKRNHG
jgi:ribosomal protein L29